MTGLVQSTRAAEDSERGDGSTYTELIPPRVSVSPGPRGISWRGIGWFACGVAGSVAIAWFIEQITQVVNDFSGKPRPAGRRSSTRPAETALPGYGGPTLSRCLPRTADHRRW